MKLDVTIHLDRFISSPMTPELGQLIDIQKCSGQRFQKSEAKQKQAIDAECEKRGLTPAAYADLVKKANRKWNRRDENDFTSPIVISSHQITAACVHTLMTIPKNARRGFTVEKFRSRAKFSDLLTQKTTHDELFQRFVRMDTSNQKKFQSDEVILDFDAVGTVELHPERSIADLEAILTYVLRDNGVGSCRKMDYGRGNLVSLTAAVTETK